jgi:hypothetical protein
MGSLEYFYIIIHYTAVALFLYNISKEPLRVQPESFSADKRKPAVKHGVSL